MWIILNSWAAGNLIKNLHLLYATMTDTQNPSTRMLLFLQSLWAFRPDGLHEIGMKKGSGGNEMGWTRQTLPLEGTEGGDLCGGYEARLDIFRHAIR